MDSEDADREELATRVDELEQTVSKMLPGRRGVLKGLGAAAIGGAAVGGATGGASGQTAAGQVGTSSEPVDVEAANVNAESVSTDDLLSESRVPQIVLREDAGIYYTVGQETIISQDGDAVTVINAAIDQINQLHTDRGGDPRQTTAILDCNNLEIQAASSITLKSGVGLHNLHVADNGASTPINTATGQIRGVWLENVYVTGAATQGMLLEEVKNSTVRNCGVFNAGDYGVTIKGCLYNHFDRFTVNGVTTFHGYNFGSAGTVQSNLNTFTHCYANNCAENGWNVKDAWSNVFIGCNGEACTVGAFDDSRGNTWLNFWAEGNSSGVGLSLNDINTRSIGYRGFSDDLEVNANGCSVFHPFVSNGSGVVIDSTAENTTLNGIADADVTDNSNGTTSMGPNGFKTGSERIVEHVETKTPSSGQVQFTGLDLESRYAIRLQMSGDSDIILTFDNNSTNGAYRYWAAGAGRVTNANTIPLVTNAGFHRAAGEVIIGGGDQSYPGFDNQLTLGRAPNIGDYADKGGAGISGATSVEIDIGSGTYTRPVVLFKLD